MGAPTPSVDGTTPPTAALRLRDSEDPTRKCPSELSMLKFELAPLAPSPKPIANAGEEGRADGGGANDEAWRRKIISCVACVTRCAVTRRIGEIV